MSSLNPVVGVSLCIGALGAGLAYLAWNNQDDHIDDSNTESVGKETAEEKNDAVGEKNTETKETNTETKETTIETNSEESSNNSDIELKTIKEVTPQKQSNMKQFLKESYENSKQD